MQQLEQQQQERNLARELGMQQRRLKLQQLQQQELEREREQLPELKGPSPTAEAAWRAGRRPGIPVGG